MYDVFVVCVGMCVVCCVAWAYVYMRTVAWLGSLPTGASNNNYKL